MAIFKGKEVQIVSAPTVDTAKFKLVDNDGFTHSAWLGELEFTETEKKNLTDQRKRDIDAQYTVASSEDLKEIRDLQKQKVEEKRKETKVK